MVTHIGLMENIGKNLIMNKIIFLDIDGVLNVYCEDKDEYGCTFHKHFEDNLKWIIDQTSAKIVISSSWRMDGLQSMQKMWKKRKIAGDIIDITPTSNDVVNLGICKYYDQVKRGHEIQLWIDKHNNNINNYVIIDDDNDMLPSQINNFVRTSNNVDHIDCIDIGYGLTRKCSEKAVKILNKKLY